MQRLLNFIQLAPVRGDEILVLDFADTFAASLEEDDGALLEGNFEDFEAIEQTIAAYVMTEISVMPKLLILPGVRYGRTSLQSVGFQSVVEEERDDVAADWVGIQRVEDDLRLFPNQAEGIALYACDDGGGYWIATDQAQHLPPLRRHDP